MNDMDCLECGQLREAYRRATRKELDLIVMRDQASMRHDHGRLEELQSVLAAAAGARSRASQNILDHENGHAAWRPTQVENKFPASRCD